MIKTRMDLPDRDDPVGLGRLPALLYPAAQRLVGLIPSSKTMKAKRGQAQALISRPDAGLAALPRLVPAVDIRDSPLAVVKPP